MKSQESTNVLDIKLVDREQNVYTLNIQSIESLYFIEDIFSFCMTGKLKFTDYGGIIEAANIWGYHTEKIIITYGLPEKKDIEKTFLIYKIDKQQPTISKLQDKNIFEITFVSPLYYQWHFKQFSRSFKEMKTSDIMKHIMKHMIQGEFYQFEQSNERIKHFYTGLRSPAENFKYLMERSTGVYTGLPGYVCFENLNGYNLVTLPKLMNNTVKVMKPNIMDNKYYQFLSKNEFLDNKINSFEREGVDNSSMQQLSGGYRMGYDIKRKKNIILNYTYKQGRNKFKDNILGSIEFPLLDPTITGQERYIKTGENREDFIDNIYFNNWLKQYSIQQLFYIYIKGDQERKAGGVINIVWPSVNKNKNNKNLTGKYFVKSIVHYFFKDQSPFYNQKLILIKNAYDGLNEK